MSTHYTYFILLAASLAGPLLLSFDKKVAFYKKWKYLFPAMLLPAIFYILWDSYFTRTGVWRFNEDYIIGLKFIHLPVEEILFFFVVPYCCVFIYECIRCYFPDLKNNMSASLALILLAVVMNIIGLLFYDRAYTAFTLLLCSFFIACLYFFDRFFRSFNAAAFILAYGIILIPFLVVNGMLTSLPVVLYNESETLSICLFTIPVEDIFYGLLLILMNVALFERFRSRDSNL